MTATLQIVDSSQLFIRLRPSGDGALPPNARVIVQRSALEDYFQVASTDEWRRRTVEANPSAIFDIAVEHFKQENYRSTQSDIIEIVDGSKPAIGARGFL